MHTYFLNTFYSECGSLGRLSHTSNSVGLQMSTQSLCEAMVVVLLPGREREREGGEGGRGEREGREGGREEGEGGREGEREGEMERGREGEGESRPGNTLNSMHLLQEGLE